MTRVANLIRSCGLVLCAMLLTSPTAIAAPSDIALLKSYTKSQLAKRPTEEVQAELQAVALKRTESIARSRGYPSSLRSSNPLIRKYILGEVANSMPVGSFTTKTQRQALVSLALNILSGSLSEKAFAYAAFQPAPNPPAKWRKRRPLSASATVNSQRPLSIDLSESMVTDDQGMVGSNNGILDPGEIATIRLQFTNTSSRRLMSTSLYVRSLSECLFTSQPLGSEIQLPELAPNKSTTVNLKVFASSECSGRTGTIYMEANDTHEFSSTPLKYSLRMSLSDATQATLVNVRIDRDDYGHSEPKGSNRIQPDDQVEISASLALRRPGYSFAEQTLMGPLGSASASHQPGRVAFGSSNGRYIARMHDDLDLTFPNKPQLLAKLRPMAEAYGWKEPKDARVYVAVDTQFGTKTSSALAPTQQQQPTYTFDSAALKQHLANHLHIEVNRTSTPPSKGRIAVGAVDGFRFEIDDPGPLMVKLQEIDLKVTQPKRVEPSSYLVRHYIELPIFWERTLNTSCMLSALRSATTGQRIPVSVSFNDVPLNSRILVNGMGLRHESTTAQERANLQIGSATMPARNSELSLLIIDPDGATICRETRRVANNTPVARPKVIASPKKTDPQLPMVTLTTNGHFGGLGGQDYTATIGRSFGVAVSAGNIGGAAAGTIGPRATQLLASDSEGFQVSLSESLEFGRRLGFSYTRATVHLSAYRVVGLNAGLHLETDPFGELRPSFRLGIGGFFGADY